MGHVQVDQACPAPNCRFYHANHGPAQCLFERSKRCNATRASIFYAGFRSFFTALRSTGGFIGARGLAQQRASTVCRQSFGAHHPGKQRLVCQILFNGSQRLLTSQKHGAHTRGGIIGRKETGLLKFHFKHGVPLVELRRACQIAEREKEAG